jgi:glycerol-3-phosphate O-acyltransferase / dihydroxyacetone phosphate acyltransferase
MWLLPVFSTVSRLATSVYYRVTVSGESQIPGTGPALLVANHPNSLLDPMLVVAVAGRPVRFLAKAPLFSDRKIGWAVRASGSIPVYRRIDDAAQSDKNVDMFRAVYDALASGSAVGIFPEGISHSEPAIAPLKTGAARIALGGYDRIGHTFPIVPVGMVLAHKEIFRSDAYLVTGPAIAWEDLAGAGSADRDAVRDLTDRIEDGLRSVTVNLDAWQDRPVVECAEQVWAAEHGADDGAADRVARTRTITTVLSELRANPRPESSSLIREVKGHARRLKRLRLTPAELHTDVSIGAGARWTARRLTLIDLPIGVIGLAGRLVWLVPFVLTEPMTRLTRPLPDQLSTHRLLCGMVLYLLWLGAMGLSIAWSLSWGWGLVAAPLAVGIGLAGLWARERWADAGRDVRRYFFLRTRRQLFESLRARQRDLAVRLQETHERRGGVGNTA